MPSLATNVCSTSPPISQCDSSPHSPSLKSFSNSAPLFRKQRIAQVCSIDTSRDCVLCTGDMQHGRRRSKVPRGIGGSTCSAVVHYDIPAHRRVEIMNCAGVGTALQAGFSTSCRLRGKDYPAGAGSTSRGNGEFHLVKDNLFRGRSFRPESKGRMVLTINCSITVPVPNEHSPVDNAMKTKGGSEASKDSSATNETKNNAREPVKAAFFDVDGTVTRTNVVLAFLSVRLGELSFLKKLLWLPWFALCCIVYLVVDHFHRPTFNRIFYLNYKGRQADGKTAMANLIYERYYKPRIMAGAVEQIQELKQLGYHVVFVTGALDFQIAPLARDLGADYVYAAKLVEENGRFTGELNGMGTSNSEKAERVWDYAKRFGVSLRDSLAFGDSIADLAMLEVVGRPHAVNPDARLLAISLKRGWKIMDWCVQKQKAAAIVPA